MNDIEKARALLREDLHYFIWRVFLSIAPGAPYLDNWHVEAIAHHLELCWRGDIKRLIITIPPRYLKSISASVAFPAWVLGHDPSRKIVCASYSQDLAIKHAIDTRSVMEQDWYRRCFPHTRPSPHKNTQSEFMTTQHGYRLATSVGGTLTGRGGNLIIIDDPHKPEEVESDTKRNTVIAWFQNTLLTRLDNKKDDVIILIQQRLHEQDLAGFLLESGNWVHLNLPAIADEDAQIPIGDNWYHDRKVGDVLHPERESGDELEKMRTDMGSYAFAAQYQQQPAPLGGGYVKWNWFKTYDKRPRKEEGDLIIQSWDTASTIGEMSDWSVCTTWHCREGNYYLLDVLRDRLEFPDLKRRIVSMANTWGADAVILEKAGAGVALIQDLGRIGSLNLLHTNPKDGKAERMLAGTPIIEAGHVLIPKEAPWLADFRHELVRFPNGKHDDQVDSLSQFLLWVRRRQLHQVPPRIECRFTPLGGPEPNLSTDDLFTMRHW